MSHAEYTIYGNDLIAVLGAGTMGKGIAEVALSAGHLVTLYNHREQSLKKAEASIRESYARRVEKGRISPAESEEQLARLTFTMDLSTIKSATLVCETIAEDLELKDRLLKDVEHLVAADAIIATNTSSFSIDRLSSSLERPQRFIGLHFFNPAPVMKLVEIIPGKRTAPAVTASAERLVTAWSKRFVTCKSTPGFLVNRLARPFYVEAFRLLDEGFDQPGLIDEALRRAGGFRMGPFELTDLIGQDVNLQVTQQIWQSMGYDPKYTPSLHQRSLVEAGLLGRKSGNGVFAYNKAAQAPDTIAADDVASPFTGAVTLYGDPGILSPLVEAASARGLAIKHAAATPSLKGSIGIDGGPLLRLTDGRPSEQLANQLGRNVVLLDLAVDYGNVAFLLLASSTQTTVEEQRGVLAFLRLANIGHPRFIDDTPGLVVARIVACLINEAAALVQQRVSTHEEVETAALLGVNYPLGLLEWRARLGSSWLEAFMRNLSEQLHPTRYRATPSFARSQERHQKTSLAS